MDSAQVVVPSTHMRSTYLVILASAKLSFVESIADLFVNMRSARAAKI